MHPATQHLLDQFHYEHLPPTLQSISRPLHQMAHAMADTLQSGPELSTGLRKLLEAKDCFVRQRVIDLREANEPAPVNTPQSYLTEAEDHKPGCKWLALTPTECTWRATHAYCPHPEHACTCADL